MLIVFEGIDGAGKDTQIRKLRAFLRQQGARSALHKFPTKKAKDAFLHLEGRKTIAPKKLAEIFAADIEGEQGRIEREIAAGSIVICDRYLHSTLAYQSAQGGFETLKRGLSAYKIVVPSLVILLDLPPDEGAMRKKGQKKPDRHEKDTAFLARVRQNYLRMAKEGLWAHKYAVIDASASEGEVFTHVLASVEPLLTKKMGR